MGKKGRGRGSITIVEPTAVKPVEATGPVVAEPAPVEPVPVAPYRINIVQSDKANPSLEMTWCLSPELMQRLASEMIHNSFLFIVVVKKGPSDAVTEIDRQLVPLKQGGTRLEFYSSGKFKIFTTVVKANTEQDSVGQYAAFESIKHITDLDRMIMEGARPSVRLVELISGRHDYKRTFAFLVVPGFDENEVNIDSEFFAPDPPAWLAKWANLWFEGRERNECHLRRRMMTAFTIQPPAVLLWILLRAVCGAIYALTLALIGWRWISLVPIFRPFAFDLKHINSHWTSRSIGMAEGYWTAGITKKGKDGFFDYPLILRILLTPLSWIILGSLAYFLVYRYPEAGISLANIAGLFALVGAFSFLTFLIGAYVINRFSKTADDRYKRKEARQKAKNQASVQRDQARIKRNFVELTCGAGGPEDGHLSSLPPRHRTLYVRFLALKGRVCRPYARG